MVAIMNIKTGYKQTEVGVIPEDWEVKCLGDNATLKARIGWQGLTTNEYKTTGDYYLITGTEFKSGFIDWHKCFYVDYDRYKQDKNIQVKTNDVLVTKDGTIGKVALIKECNLATLNSGVFVIRPINQAFEPKFFYYLLMSETFITFLSQLSAGSTINHLYQKDFVNFKFQIPSTKTEQTAIATALSDTDALIESLEKLIAKKRLIKQGAMQELLTGKKRLAGFSGDWEVKTFGEIFDYLPTATNSRADLSESGDVYYIHYGDIHTHFHNHLNFKKTQPSKIERCKCKNAAFLQNGDWIMADASEDFDGVGKSIEILGLDENIKAVAGLHTFLLREKYPAFAPMFKGHLGNLKSLHEQFLRVATGMKVFGVSKTALKNLVLKIPTKEEQTAIATILSDMDAEISALETKLSKTRQIKQGMMPELLTGRIRLVS